MALTFNLSRVDCICLQEITELLEPVFILPTIQRESFSFRSITVCSLATVGPVWESVFCQTVNFFCSLKSRICQIGGDSAHHKTHSHSLANEQLRLLCSPLKPVVLKLLLESCNSYRLRMSC